MTEQSEVFLRENSPVSRNAILTQKYSCIYMILFPWDIEEKQSYLMGRRAFWEAER